MDHSSPHPDVVPGSVDSAGAVPLARALLAVAVAVAGVLAGCARSPAAPLSASGEPPRRVTFACDRGQALAVTFAGETATLEASGRSVQLARQLVASGLHYAGGGHQLRGKGDELTWTDPSGAERLCRDQRSAMRQPQVQPARPELAGTSWQLVHFESSDDAIGKKVPPNADRYRMTFVADGTLALRLDCNRATGRWEAKPASAAGGSIALAGGAMTRAFCGPGALDAQIARDLARVRSYRFSGDRLGLALEADGGIYLWAPASAEP